MPKTLRPAGSSSQLTARLRPGSRPHGNVEDQRQGGMSSDVALTHSTSVPSSSSPLAASQRAPSDSSNSDFPDSWLNTEPNSHVPLPPPLPSSPPPPPPLLPGTGTLLLSTVPGSSIAHPGTRGMNTDAADLSSSPGPSVPLCPPGPAPILSSVSVPLSPTLHKSQASADESAARPGVDLASIEAARLRLKKSSRNDTSVTCELYVLC